MVNKLISVWRGNLTPPTNYHLWLDGNHLKKNINGEWINLNTLPEELQTALYQSRLDLTKYENILGINVLDAKFVNNIYQLKGSVIIPVPRLGTYNILLRINSSTDATILANNKTYNIGDVVSLKFTEVSSISFFLSNYVSIKEIIIEEVADINSFELYLEVPEDNKFYARYNNTWKALNFEGDIKLDNSGKIMIDKTDKMEEDNDKVITSRGVFNVVGDVETLLSKL